MRIVPRFTFLAFAGALALGTAAIAAQDAGTSALKGHDSSAPVDVTADRMELQNRADRAIFAGNVRVRQNELTLQAARLTVAYSSAGGIEIQRLDAGGGVTVTSPSESARGDFGIYDLNNKLITLIGNVRLKRGANEIFGQRLTIDMSSGRAVVDGGPAGVNQSGGRVTGRFTVPKKKGD